MKRIVVFILLVVLATACAEKNDKKATLEKLKNQRRDIEKQIAGLEKEMGVSGNQLKAKNVAVFAVSSAEFSNYVDVQGRLETDRIVNAGAQIPGIIRGVYVRRGDYVGAGQVLADIDGSTILKSIQQLKTNIELAKTVYEKQKSLWDQKVGTEISFLQAKAGYESAAQQLSSLQDQYSKTRVVAPISGVVEEVYMKVGEAGSPGAPGIKIVSASDIRAVADVSETYSSQLKQGADVIVYIEDLKMEVKGKIAFVAQTINNISRSIRVEAIIPYNKDFRPNMVVKIKVQNYQKQEAITVPINIIQSSPEGSFIMVAVEEKGQKIARRRLVKLGQIYNRKAEIVSGLQAGDKVVTLGYQDLNENDLISYKN